MAYSLQKDLGSLSFGNIIVYAHESITRNLLAFDYKYGCSSVITAPGRIYRAYVLKKQCKNACLSSSRKRGSREFALDFRFRGNVYEVVYMVLYNRGY